jgi:WD40 repeat protein
MSACQDVFRRSYKTSGGGIVVATTGNYPVDDEIMHNTVIINCLKNGNMMFMDHNFNKISDIIEPKYGALLQGDIGLKRINRFCHHAILHTISMPESNNTTTNLSLSTPCISEKSGGSNKSSIGDYSNITSSNLHLSIVQGGEDGYIRLYHVSPMRNVKKFPEERETLVIPVRDQPCKVTAVHLYIASSNNVYDSDKLYVIAGTSLGFIYIWNALELGSEINTIETVVSTKHASPIIQCMATFCPGNDLNPVVIIGDSHCHIKMFDTLTGERKNSCVHSKTIDTNKHTGIQSLVCYSPSINGFGNKNANGDSSETVIITSSVDKSIIIWSYDSLDKLREIRGHTDVVSSLSVTCLTDPYNPVIVSGSDDCTIRLWLFSSGEELRKLKPHIKLDNNLMRGLRNSTYTYDYHDLKPKKINSVSVCMFGSYRDALVVSSGEDGNLMAHNFGASECIKSINSKLKIHETVDSLKSRSGTPTDIQRTGNFSGTYDSCVSEFTYDSTQEHYITSTFAFPSQWMYHTDEDMHELSDVDVNMIRNSLAAFTAGRDSENEKGNKLVSRGVDIIKSNLLAGRKRSTVEPNPIWEYNAGVTAAAPAPKNTFYTSHPLILSVIDEKLGIVKFWSATESKYDKILQLGDYLNYDNKFKLNLIRPTATSALAPGSTATSDDESNYLVMTCYRGIQSVTETQSRARSLTNRAVSKSDDVEDVIALESNNKYNKHHYLTLWELRKGDITAKENQRIIEKKEYIGHKNVVKCVIIFDTTAVGGAVTIASGDADGNILFWDAKSPSGSEPIGVLRAHKGSDDYGVNVLAISEVYERDSPYSVTWPFLFSGGGDKLLKMWQINDIISDPNTNANVRIQSQPKLAKARDLRTSSLNSDLLDDDDEDDVDQTNILVEFEHESPVSCISFTKAESLGVGMHNKEKYSTLVITGTVDGVIRLWSMQHTMSPLVKIDDISRSGINTMDVYQSRDLNWNWVVAGISDGSIKVYDLKSKKLIREYNHSIKKIKNEASHPIRNAPIKSLAIIAPSITAGLPIKEPIIYSINECNDVDVWDTYYSCYSTEPLSSYIIRQLFCYDRNDLKHRYGVMQRSMASSQHHRSSIIKRGSSKLISTTNTVITGRLVTEDVIDSDDDTIYSYIESTNQGVDMNGNKDSKKEDSIAFKWSRLYHAFEDRGGNILFKVLTHLTTYSLTHPTTYLLTHQGEPAAYVGGDRQGND